MKKKLSKLFLNLFNNVPIEKSITELSKGGNFPINEIKRGKYININVTEHPLGYLVERILPSGTKVSYLIDGSKTEKIEKIITPATGNISQARLNYARNKKLLSSITDINGSVYKNSMTRNGWANPCIQI